MQLGMIGLGRMGGNIVRRLMKNGHRTVVYDKDPKAVATLAADGAVGAGALEDFVGKLEKPRTVWVMLPAGKITEATIDALSKLMQADDVIIDGGNTFWQDDVRRGKALKEKRIHYVDVGTSGGVWGIDRGYCMMIGGDKAVVDRLDPIFAALAPLAPVSTAEASNSSCSDNCSTSVSRRSVSSSTIRILRALAMRYNPLGGGGRKRDAPSAETRVVRSGLVSSCYVLR